MATRTTSTVLVCALIVLIFFNGAGASNPSQNGKPAQGKLDPPRVMLEVIFFCSGMCGRKWNKDSVRFYADGTAEYRLLMSTHPLPDYDERPVSQRSIHLDLDEFDLLMSLIQKSEFQNANTDYDSRVNFVDSMYMTTVTCYGERPKRVFLKNYLPAEKESKDEPPPALRDIVKKASDVIERINASR